MWPIWHYTAGEPSGRKFLAKKPTIELHNYLQEKNKFGGIFNILHLAILVKDLGLSHSQEVIMFKIGEI